MIQMTEKNMLVGIACPHFSTRYLWTSPDWQYTNRLGLGQKDVSHVIKQIDRNKKYPDRYKWIFHAMQATGTASFPSDSTKSPGTSYPKRQHQSLSQVLEDIPSHSLAYMISIDTSYSTCSSKTIEQFHFNGPSPEQIAMTREENNGRSQVILSKAPNCVGMC